MRIVLNLRTSRKFIVLGALAAVAIILPCFLYARLALKDLNFAQQELRGVPVIRSLYEVVRLTQEHRGLSTSMLSGVASAAAQREAKAAEVVRALDAATAQLAASDAAAVKELWGPVAGEWRTLVEDVAGKRVEGPQSFGRHTALVEAQLQTLSTALDYFNWSLDPEPNTYFSITGSAIDGILLTERLGRLRALGAGALARKNVTPEDKLRIHAQLVLAEDTYARSKRGLDKAGEADAAMAAVYRPLQQRLEGSLRAALKTTLEQVVDGGLAMESTAYFGVMTDVIRQQLEINQQVTQLLERALSARMDAIRNVMLILGVALVAATAAFAAMAWLVARTTTERLLRAQHAAKAMATGDLSAAVVPSGRDELGQLLEALRAMQGQLAGIVVGVRRNAEYVASASQQIAQGNDDLSARTEQQASSLQETAASMEQMNGTIRQNADNAHLANQLVAGASTVALRGGEEVARVVGTMQNIHESSKRIAEITGVIDGIAFQTNILALNAAVEAARAGEQGRGFAVVAGEVRSLAQRSAQAAREIKDLIGTSVGRVNEGSHLVRQAGQTMQEVVTSIRRVADIVGEIASASREQATGVGQISEAVANMDQTTQQNAALVEQSAAAAQSLRTQAGQLVAAVSVFRMAPTDSALPVARLA